MPSRAPGAPTAPAEPPPADAKAEAPPADTEPEDEDEPELTVELFFEESDYEYTAHATFHTLHLREDARQLLIEVDRAKMGALFWHSLVLDGAEGGLPDFFDGTARNAIGLHFTAAPNSRDVYLSIAQQRLPADNVAASMYSKPTGGLRGGFIRALTPVVDDEAAGVVLLDITEWIWSFSQYVQNADHFEGGERQPREGCACGSGGGGAVAKRRPMRMGGGGGPSARGGVRLVEVLAFKQNFLLRMVMQLPGPPLKSGRDGTAYFTLSFCLLPEVPATPRQWDRRVGYFTTQIMSALYPTAPTISTHVINRWNLARSDGHITYVIDDSVPKLFHDTIRQGVLSWNPAFESAGCGPGVLVCVAPGDAEWPEDYTLGDARFNSIYMTNPDMEGLYGYGPSIADFRSGEILVGRVLLGYHAFVEGASAYSLEVLTDDRERPQCGRLPPLLDMDHPDVLKKVRNTVVHEVGHTLGLRHNFIGSEDGHSSIMDYEDALDTTDPSNPVIAGHYRSTPGPYDDYAIRYGYTPLPNERAGHYHPALALLANGQQTSFTDALHPAQPSAAAQNPLFATDESIGDDVDPRVNRWSASVRKMGADKIRFAAERRVELLSLVQSAKIFPETYTRKLLSTLRGCSQSLMMSSNFVGGSTIDQGRRSATAVDESDTRQLMKTAVELLTGPTWRFSAEETRYLLVPRSHGSSWKADNSDFEPIYSLAQPDVLTAHLRQCNTVLGSLLHERRLQRVEAQRSTAAGAGAGAALSTLSILQMVGFGTPDWPGLFQPLRPATSTASPDAAALDAAGSDSLLSAARMALAEQLHSLQHSKAAHPAARVGARAFIAQAVAALDAVLGTEDDKVGRLELGAESTAAWELLREELLKEKEQGGGMSGMMAMFGGGHDGPASRL